MDIVDVNGNTCPLLDRSGLTCPVLCVLDFKDCPKAIEPPTCASNEQLCDDGTCQKSCAAVVNPCLCGLASSDVAAAYKACPAYEKTVAVPSYDPSIKTEQLTFACAKEWGLVAANSTLEDGSGVPSWSAESTDQPMSWSDCPTPQEPELTFTENFCIAFYAILGAELVLYLLWHIYKSVRERHVSSLRQVCSQIPSSLTISKNSAAIASAGSEIQADTEKNSILVAEGKYSSISSISNDLPTIASAAELPEGMLLLRGFDNSYVGMSLYYLSLLSTAGWIVLLAIVVADYYGKVKGGIAYGLLANSNTSMAVFIFVWHLAAVWMVVVLACMSRLRNYFRIECPLSQAYVVQVEERQEEMIMMEGTQNRLTLLVNRIRESLVRKFDLNIVIGSCTAQHISPGDERVFIEYHCTRYVLSSAEGSRFQCHSFDLGNTHRALLAHRNGLTTQEARDRGFYIGKNFIRVIVPSFPVALLREFLSYIYLYQMMCMWVWFYFNYYKMALVQFSVIIASAFVKVAIRLHSEYKVKSLAEHNSQCRVKRDGKWSKLSTADLVPGDVVAVEAGMEIMCDGCVLQGEVVVDESSLTGEAMPVRKLPLKMDYMAFDAQQGTSKSYSVIAGTRVLQCTGSVMTSPSQSLPSLLSGKSFAEKSSSNGYNSAVADLVDEPETQILVTQTRTSTDKGKLIKRILFPVRYSFVFDEQLRVAVLFLLAYAGLGFALSIWLMGHDMTSWLYGVFVLAQTCQPLIPASLTIGQSVAAHRLRRQSIFCIDLPRTIMAGKVQVFCFDKTGTLTKEGLEYFAVQAIQKTSDGDNGSSCICAAQFLAEVPDMARLANVAQVGLAACHAVTVMDDQLIGNPVDVEQLRATDWEIKQGERDSELYLDTLISPFLESIDGSDKLCRQTIHVIKRFEFVHARQSMSVAVLDQATGHVHVFVKGSFERLKQMANAQSVPADYDTMTARWAREGCYVLALAHKDLGPVDDLATVTRMSREQIENGCDLVSLLLFRNKLKEDTASAIMELKGGDTRTVMITGDTALTGVYIARQCGMVSSTARVILGDIDRSSIEEAAEEPRLVWHDTADDSIVDDIDKLLFNEQRDIEEAEQKLGNVVSKRTPSVELAVTAAAFDYLVSTNNIRKYLLDIRIFARMTPQGKVECVQLHMERAVTAMCGDGGNDCGALRAAHVGIALSDSEASIVSPFSSSNRSIHSCVTLLREGRSGLATSIAGYKFLINYGTTMSMLEIVQFYFSVIVPQAVWIMIDSFITVGLCIAVTQAQTARKLAPSRPTARLIGAHTLASIWGQTAINYAFLYGMMGLLFRQSWFRCHEFDSRDIDTSLWWLLGDNYEAEVISLVCMFQFVNAAAVYNFGYRYRRAWITNYILAALYAGFIAIISILVLADPNRFSCMFRINCGNPDTLVDIGYSRPSWDISSYNNPAGHNVMPHKFRWTLWALCITNIVLCLIWEKLVVLGPVGRLAKKWWVGRRGDPKLQLKL
ncbi:hypothetical protein LPJ64_003941 [Coemansia asiatica]|uniref:P-type ATPase A domain-containing protein n=1 Tax=Coemansia asiatica TaxID=1052880 RepID=A0A9W8CJ32_9FUNG|nr:hypothetical protein LPJ64_003941 [Coemansia asiatica]